jgi:3-phenylpropionate/trans-cinnamate dioxygenase ferredoxin reductase subunit
VEVNVQDKTSPGIVVIGGSYAGLNAAAAARTAGYGGSITLLADEAQPPYQRPPLSKDFLRGTMQASQLPLRPAAFYETNRIDVRLATRATRIDRQAKAVELAGGGQLPYDKLILATGCRARLLTIPGSDAQGIHYLRTLDDSVAIAKQLDGASHVTIVGGGFIGLEIAASLRAKGMAVDVVEAQPRLLARAMPAVMSEYVHARHAKEGVNVHFSAQLASFTVEAGRVAGVVLADGRSWPADLVIVGIGVLPNQEIAEEAGLECRNGIVVDAFARTSDPSIFAAGDCTSHPNAFLDGAFMRLECVQNAIDQGRVAGANAAGSETRYNAPPWFWSDQFDMKLQGTGLSMGFDSFTVRGRMEEGAFSIFYFRGGRLAAVDTVNKPGEHMMARKLLAAGAPLSAEQAADVAFDLKQLIKP